jgi:hypothetical protein
MQFGDCVMAERGHRTHPTSSLKTGTSMAATKWATDSNVAIAAQLTAPPKALAARNICGRC